MLAIYPHEICPVDGEVIEGHGEMDESYLTDEPFEIGKAPGSQVLSGAVNRNTVLKIRATRLAVDSRYARILKVVEEAEQDRPRMRRIADRLGAWYTPLALLLGVVGWLIGGTTERFLAVAVIATPCPLLIGIPWLLLAYLTGRQTRHRHQTAESPGGDHNLPDFLLRQDRNSDLRATGVDRHYLPA